MRFNSALYGTKMKSHRVQSEKIVFANFSTSDNWEAWHLRFNKGAKLNKPVKFFASKVWSLNDKGTQFGGTHWDFADVRSAEEWFAAELLKDGGIMKDASPTLVKELTALGYKLHNLSLNSDPSGRSA